MRVLGVRFGGVTDGWQTSRLVACFPSVLHPLCRLRREHFFGQCNEPALQGTSAHS